MLGRVWCFLPLILCKSQCFGLAFHSKLTLRMSWCAPPDTGVSSLQLVALEQLPSIEGAVEIRMDVTFLRGPCRGGALLRPLLQILTEAVGADAYIGPKGSTNLPEIFINPVHSAWADVGIGPYTGFKILSVIRYLEKQKKMLDRTFEFLTSVLTLTQCLYYSIPRLKKTALSQQHKMTGQPRPPKRQDRNCSAAHRPQQVRFRSTPSKPKPVCRS